MVATPFLADAEQQFRRVREHIDELRRSGRNEDAEAVTFVRDLAEQALSGGRPAPQRGLLTTGQAGLALGISDQTVRNWVAAGRLPAVKRGVRSMIPREAVLKEIQRSRVPPRPQPESAAEEEAVQVTWRKELLAALPQEARARLDALHDKLEDGEISTEEQAEMARGERAMIDAAALYLERLIRRGRAGET